MNSVLKTTLTVTASAVTLLVVAVVVGVGYAWYVGEYGGDSGQNIQPTTHATGGVLENKRPKISDTASIGAVVQNITSPVVPGSNASIMVRTNPDANCAISVIYDKTPSRDSGLGEKKADEYGIVEWTWTVEGSVPLGKWPVEVTCANKKNSAVVENALHVVKTLE